MSAYWEYPGYGPTNDEVVNHQDLIFGWFRRKQRKLKLPFDLLIDGVSFREVQASWTFCNVGDRFIEGARQYLLAWSDPETKLAVWSTVTLYENYPTVEWTVHLRNEGDSDTPLIENLYGLDLVFKREETGEFLLRHNVGSPGDETDYRPLLTPLGPGARAALGGEGGRASSKDMPYFNLDWGDRGVICAVGWPGKWKAGFKRNNRLKCRVRTGQERTRFRLHPGEYFRSPLIVLQSWEGDWIHAQNVWRRWMVEFNLPRPGGQPVKPLLLAGANRAFEEMMNATVENQIQFIDRYVEEGIDIDAWWMDAGWYPNQGRWGDVGTWEVDRKRFPDGLRPISDHAHANGIKTMLWFEPERVAPGSWLESNKPEWVLDSPTADLSWGRLLNLGELEVLDWVTERVDSILQSEGIDWYRQDHNVPPLDFWRTADAEDRQGIAENRHVFAYLALWDELQRRHPGMLIDSCASGGRRNDLKTMRRAVPLWRSDYAFVPDAHQQQTYGIAMWLPFFGTGTVACEGVPYYGSGHTEVQGYAFWSNCAPSLVCMFDMREKGLDYDAIRRLISARAEIADDFLGDYYPLTPCHEGPDEWIAWEFVRPELGRGFVTAFRRPECADEKRSFPLHGIDKDADYTVWNAEYPDRKRQVSGRELAEDGLVIGIKTLPGAETVAFRKVE